MAQEWYYLLGGKQHGPVTETELKQLVGTGKIQQTDMVWKQGMAQWIAASNVMGVLPKAAPVAKVMASPSPAAADQFYYSKNGTERQGPVSSAQLQNLARAGQLLPTDFVWKQGMAQWTPANKLVGVLDRVFAAATAPPALPPSIPQPAPQEEPGRRIDLAMLAVLDAPIDDVIIFRWARQQLGNDERRVQLFQQTYLSKKKQKATAHTLNIAAFFFLGGIHRLYLGDVALGIAHFLTVGFCWIGTIIDFFAINKRVNDANVKVAMQSLEVIHAM